MSKIGERERATQNRVVKFFCDELGFDYLGNWQDRKNNTNVEPAELAKWLTKQGYSTSLQSRVFRELDIARSLGAGRKLYQANKEVYSLLRYGVKVKDDGADQNQTVWLINWKEPHKNDFAIAEEVTVDGHNRKRPDVVLYINGIAVGVIELKRSSASVAEGIRQNLDNQSKEFIPQFFTTMQLVMAANDSEGLRYGAMQTPEKHYYTWREPELSDKPLTLEQSLQCLCSKERLLELIHNFVVFDKGVKKLCRHNQFHGLMAARPYIERKESGIIWHTQGSGKSLTMVWLAKWIRENAPDPRVLLITDRTELDEQIEGVFHGVDEKLVRSRSADDLVATLNKPDDWLIGSLVHKFGRHGEIESDKATEDYIAALKKSLPGDFKAKGNIFVFVDECHRTQSGKLHDAMKLLLPDATFIGFTGTPLLKKDKKTSMEVFGGFIHQYKFDEAVADGVVLDLQYEARDIDQYVTSPGKVDQWFDAKTRGLSDTARAQLKDKWGTLKKVLSSQDRLTEIVKDIEMDMATKPRLSDGTGNAMLVCSSIYQACKVYELFGQTEFAGKCAIVTSYHPSPADIKGEATGEGLTEKLQKYEIYRKMIADYFDISEDEAENRAEDFEKKVKEAFVEEPGQMRLLIVVDKLLTGFDAPAATYLYIDKEMRDHGLFQAICRVNRLDGDTKDYGFIIDYKDLFHRLESSITSYTTGAFENYEEEDVKGLLSDRLQKGAEKLTESRENVKAICEPVLEPREEEQYRAYFIGDPANPDEREDNLSKRLTLYKAVGQFVRAYANLANEMQAAGFSFEEEREIKAEVEHFGQLVAQMKLTSGDYVDLKLYEPAMRRLLDTYVSAHDSEKIADFEELGLIDLILQRGEEGLNDSPVADLPSEEAVAETIENNMRKVIIDEQQVNPQYFDKMSELLDALIEERRQQALDYKTYLEKVKELAGKIKDGGAAEVARPASIDTSAKAALYDNFGQDEIWTAQVDAAIRASKPSDWVGNELKERQVASAIYNAVGDEVSIPDVLELVKHQLEYQ